MKPLSILFGFLVPLAAPLLRADDAPKAGGAAGSISDPAVFRKVMIENHLGPDWCPDTTMRWSSEVIAPGTKLTSPDGRFTAELTRTGYDCAFVIRDAKTGRTDRVAEPLPPVLAWAWSPDSRTLVVVGHASETSLLEVVHRGETGWRLVDIDDPTEGGNDKFHVEKWEFGPKLIRATYLVNQRSANGATGKLYRCRFDIDPIDGTVSHVMKSPVTLDEYIAARTARN